MLPVGWEKRETLEGKPYYADTINQTTQWDAPAFPAPSNRPLNVQPVMGKVETLLFDSYNGGFIIEKRRPLYRIRLVCGNIIESLNNTQRYVQDVSFCDTESHVLGCVTITDQPELPGTWSYTIFTNQNDGIYITFNVKRRITTNIVKSLYEKANSYANQNPAAKRLYGTVNNERYSYLVVFSLQ